MVELARDAAVARRFAMTAAADRHLLFGLLALQNGIINQGQLLGAFQAWTLENSRSLADHLEAGGALDAARRALLEALAVVHLQAHGGDVQKSLAAISAGTSTQESLARIGGPKVEATLAHLIQRQAASVADTDADRTTTYSVGTATSDGQRFRVLRPHAKGGLGAVFVALDSELNREVALKQMLDQHADDPVSRQRFLIEAEVTGGLEHPGIVPVYGLGTYGDGRPYYAMRFIRGDSLKEAIEAYHQFAANADPGARTLELRTLLRRFTDVCNAIEYAHSRGVLHRDIKPGNVIVGNHGETLVVDWGLAKALGKADAAAPNGEHVLLPSSASGTVETLPGSALGTPAYMSPEQASGELDRLGPRSDVYSLGATLYCLLTGEAPFDGDIFDVVRKVQKGDFPRPRQIDPSIDPALEAVCLKAMATSPDARYPSCRALARDVDRWTADEPVTAFAEPFMRRTRRWAKRHQTAVTAATVALVAGVVGLSAVAAVQSKSNAALTRANAAVSQALAETQAAQKQTAVALAQSDESRKQSEAVGNFLVDAFKKPNPAMEGKDVKVADILDQAFAGLAKGFSGSKATEGALLDALGKSYFGLGLFPKAEEAYRKAHAVRERALGSLHRDTLSSATDLARSLWQIDRCDDCVALHEATLERKKQAFGPDDPDTLQTRWFLANALTGNGRAAEAIPLHLQILATRESKLGPDHLETLHSRGSLATAYRRAGRNADAIALFESTLKLMESTLGPDHPITFPYRNSLGLAYRAAGRTAEAIATAEAILKVEESKLGPDHPHTLDSRTDLADTLSATGRTAEAIGILTSNLKNEESKLGFVHPLTMTCRNSLANAYRSAGRCADAIALLEPAIKLFDAKHGPDNPGSLWSRHWLAYAYLDARRISEAIALFESTLKLSASKLGADHANTRQFRVSLARAYLDAGRSAEAIAMLESTLALVKLKRGTDDPETLFVRNDLIHAYERFGRWPDAEPLARDQLARTRTKEKPDSVMLAYELAMLGQNLLKQSRWSEAEPLLRECLAIRVKAIPDDYRRFNAASLLGDALLGQGKYAEAEPLVVDGYEGIKVRKAKLAASAMHILSDAEERVVHLYKAWGKPDQVAAWTAKLGLADLPAHVFAE
jgi:eukaryotic-like serine/threonine-protein kinase